MGKFTDALQFWTKPLTRGVRAMTNNLDEQEQEKLGQEQDNLYQSILSTTKPLINTAEEERAKKELLEKYRKLKIIR